MSKFLPVEDYFECIYLIDLSPSLLEIARKRFARLGWSHVKLICQDVRDFRLDESQKKEAQNQDPERADLITLSYSLTMIPDFFPVVDLLTTFLSSFGVIGVVDFYVQNMIDLGRRNYTGGDLNRHVHSLSRMFWRAWFDFDRVNLEPARRDYLEYRFGSILNLNFRNYYLGAIPFYIWIGCPRKLKSWSKELSHSQADTEQVREISSRLPLDDKVTDVEPTIGSGSGVLNDAFKNLRADLPLPSFFYQNNHRRIPYRAELEKFCRPGKSHLSSWADAQSDLDFLKITKDDVILSLTGRGVDGLLAASACPRKLIILDQEPARNHRIELELAILNDVDINHFLKPGKPNSSDQHNSVDHARCRHLLISKVSPHVSSRALQFGLQNPGSLHISGLASAKSCSKGDPNTLMQGNSDRLRIYTDTMDHHLSRTPHATISIAIVRVPIVGLVLSILD